MKFSLFVLPTVPGTLEDRERLRPIGRNNERFQEMLDEVRTLCVMADEFGFDCFSTTEHHFHSEGYEASVAPLPSRPYRPGVPGDHCARPRLHQRRQPRPTTPRRWALHRRDAGARRYPLVEQVLSRQRRYQ